MKVFVSLLLFFTLKVALGSDRKLVCSVAPTNVPSEWITMTDPCLVKMKKQIQTELEAAMTYMAMGAHFYKDSVNKKGFGNFFFDSASEEREHAMKFIEYLLMRGELTQDVRDLIQKPKPLKTEWANAAQALREALKLEASVTEKIREIIKTCENPASSGGADYNDYHLVDYLTGEMLEEQHKGQRELAGHISSLGKMENDHGHLAEFLYDKKLLSEAVPAL